MCNSAFNGFAVTGTVHNRGVLFGDLDLFCTTKLRNVSVFQLQAEVGGDDFAAGQNSDILQHFFSSVTEARCFHANAGEGAAQFVDQNGGKSFAFHVFGDDDQFLTGLNDFFKQRQDFLNVGNLLVGNQNISVVNDRFHFVGIGYHVRGNVAAVKLHAFHNVAVSFRGLGLFNGDNAVCRDLFHRVRNQLADEFVRRGNGSDSCNVVSGLNRFCFGFECFDNCVNCHLHAFFHDHRVCARRNVLHAFAHKRLCEQGSGRGAVAGNIVRLGGDFFHELCAHVFESVFQFHFFCNRNTVVGNQRCAVFLIENHVSAFGAERDFNGVAQFVNTGLQRFARFFAVNNLFCHFKLPPENYSTTARMSA